MNKLKLLNYQPGVGIHKLDSKSFSGCPMPAAKPTQEKNGNLAILFISVFIKNCSCLCGINSRNLFQNGLLSGFNKRDNH